MSKLIFNVTVGNNLVTLCLENEENNLENVENTVSHTVSINFP
jgi:hypothetical protein